MKKIYMALAALWVAGAGFAQTETTKTNTDTTGKKVDTIKVGNFIIIKENRLHASGRSSSTTTVERKPYKPARISTNWLIFDLGYANVNDKTDYTGAEAQNFLQAVPPGERPGQDDLKLRANKTSNVNIWVVMQKVSIGKGYFNIKYGLGLEMFNFRYESNIRYNKSPNYIYKDTISFSKNKLFSQYGTIPLMLNFNSSPGRKKGFSISAGVSAGYLISSHTKEVSAERGKEKTKGDLGLEKFRLAYVGEVGIGPIRLFGSYSISKLHQTGLEQYPYSMGIRFSNW